MALNRPAAPAGRRATGRARGARLCAHRRDASGAERGRPVRQSTRARRAVCSSSATICPARPVGPTAGALDVTVDASGSRLHRDDARARQGAGAARDGRRRPRRLGCVTLGRPAASAVAFEAPATVDVAGRLRSAPSAPALGRQPHSSTGPPLRHPQAPRPPPRMASLRPRQPQGTAPAQRRLGPPHRLPTASTSRSPVAGPPSATPSCASTSPASATAPGAPRPPRERRLHRRRQRRRRRRRSPSCAASPASSRCRRHRPLLRRLQRLQGGRRRRFARRDRVNRPAHLLLEGGDVARRRRIPSTRSWTTRAGYSTNLFRFASWKKLLRGNVNIRDAAQTVIRHGANVLSGRVRDLARTLGRRVS